MIAMTGIAFPYSFRPRPWSTLAVAVLVPIFIGLGYWQLGRAHSKEAVERQLERSAASPAIVLPNTTIVDAESLRNRHVLARGHYEKANQFFLDNRVWRGRAGYDVLTPLHLDGSDLRILVDRGWIAAPAERGQLPEVETPTQSLAVEGIAIIPPAWTFSLAPPDQGWEPIWQTLDLKRFQTLTGQQLQPAVIRLAPQSPAGGFNRDWPRADQGVTRNLGYAMQWFGFAATAAGLWLWFAIERKPQ